MKIVNLEDVLPNGAVTEVEQRFKKWFDNAKADGLEYVCITLESEMEAFFKDPLSMPYVAQDLQKVLTGFLDANDAIDKGQVYEEYFDDVERHDASELFNKVS